jgi:hypothetical protein
MRWPACSDRSSAGRFGEALGDDDPRGSLDQGENEQITKLPFLPESPSSVSSVR